VERSTDGVTFTQVALLGASATSYSDTGLAASTTYYYEVLATNAAGDSTPSNVANATTQAAVSAPPATPRGERGSAGPTPGGGPRAPGERPQSGPCERCHGR
jgi:titin